MSKGTLYMSLNSKRLVGIVASTALLSLVSAAANAQVFSTQYGTWYTDRLTWESYITNFQTANYDTPPTSNSAPWTESDITATAGTTTWEPGNNYLSAMGTEPVTFTFAGNAFGGDFSSLGSNITLNFTVDSSPLYPLLVTAHDEGYTFLGYISNSSSNISVTVRPSADQVVVDSFTRANGTNPSNPGSNVAPEPGSFALALTGGVALSGICVRRRRNAV